MESQCRNMSSFLQNVNLSHTQNITYISEVHSHKHRCKIAWFRLKSVNCKSNNTDNYRHNINMFSVKC